VGHEGTAGRPSRVGGHVAGIEAITCRLAQDEATERVVADRAGEGSRRAEPRTRAGEDGRRAADEGAVKGARSIERLVRAGSHDLDQHLAQRNDPLRRHALPLPEWATRALPRRASPITSSCAPKAGRPDYVLGYRATLS